MDIIFGITIFVIIFFAIFQISDDYEERKKEKANREEEKHREIVALLQAQSKDNDTINKE